MKEKTRHPAVVISVTWLIPTVFFIGGFCLDQSLADTASTNRGDATSDKEMRLEELGVEYDTRYVDQLTLPRVAAPLASASALESSAGVGRNTQKSINPSAGANVQANTGFFPRLVIRRSSRDNPARVAGGEDQSDDSLFVGLDLKYRGLIKNRHLYEVGALVSGEEYDELVTLDTEKLDLSAALRLDITEKLKTDLYTSYLESNDSRGITATRLLDTEEFNDEFEDTTFGGRVTIGRRSNPLQLVFGAEYSNLDFTNNDQSQRDREDDQLLAGLYFNVSPVTSLFVSGKQTDIDYKSNASADFDSRNTEVVLGLGWEPSYSSSILLQVGNIDKSFNNSQFEDQDTDSYLGKFTWLPNGLSTINLYASKTYEESVSRESPLIESVLTGVNLAHNFTDAIRGRAHYNLIEDDLINVRLDEISDYGFGLFYRIRRWIEFSATWARAERDSTDANAVYNSEIFSISLAITPRFNRDFGDSRIQTGGDLRGVE